MQIFVLLSVVAMAFGAPRPEEEAVVAEAYVHEDIAAEPYVHEDIAAEAYVHEDIAAEAYVHEDIAAEAYVHEDIAAEAYVHEDPAYNHEEIPAEEYVHVEGPSAPAAAPVVYSGVPYVHAYAGYPYGAVAYAGLPTLTAAAPVAEVKAAEVEAKPVVAPVPYTYGYPYSYSLGAYPYLVHHTGCVNNLGSVVPCA